MKCRFEEFLVNYQDDLKRIIGKHLTNTLHIKVDDVVSVTNQQLLSTKDKFFERFGYDFTKSDFGKWAYNYARNLTKWQAIRYINKDAKLQDGSFYTDEGEKSLFDIVAEATGEENEELEQFDKGEKLRVITNIINKYSHVLTEHEKEVFEGLLQGVTELELSQKYDSSRQAINLTKSRIYDKIHHSFGSFSVEDEPIVSLREMDSSLEVVLDILNKAEVRRLKYHSVSSTPNKNLYTYAIE
jgi:RNA polymerase sigma factor (sigma-70 family)